MSLIVHSQIQPCIHRAPAPRQDMLLTGSLQPSSVAAPAALRPLASSQPFNGDLLCLESGYCSTHHRLWRLLLCQILVGQACCRRVETVCACGSFCVQLAAPEVSENSMATHIRWANATHTVKLIITLYHDELVWHSPFRLKWHVRQVLSKLEAKLERLLFWNVSAKRGLRALSFELWKDL